MTETARVLLTAGILSAVALSTVVWRITRQGRAPHEILIDQLRLSQWAALLLAGSGAAGIGMAVAAAAAPDAVIEATAGVVAMAASLAVLRREPPSALLVAGLLFFLHAAFNLAHRPAVLAPEFVPHWWSIGSATYDVYLAALCLVARRY